MAFLAVAVGNDLVGTVCIFRQYFFVAFVAKFCPGFGQQVFVGGGMRNVASGTIPGFKQRMHITAFERFLKFLVAFQANLPFGAGFQFEFVRRICAGAK